MLKRSAFEAFTGSTKLIFLKHWFCSTKISKSYRTWPAHSPTTKSAMVVSSVSPLRWLTITPQPLLCASLHLITQTNKQTLTAEKIQGCFGERYFIYRLTQAPQFACEGYRIEAHLSTTQDEFWHGTVQYSNSVYDDLWTAKRLNFRTPVKVVACERNTQTHEFKRF